MGSRVPAKHVPVKGYDVSGLYKYDGVDAPSRRHRDVPRWCLAIVDHLREEAIHMEEASIIGIDLAVQVW